jgi:hypothetical protein
MDTLGTGAGNLNLTFQIGSAWYKYIVFRRYSATTGIYTDEDISTKTFSFSIKKNKGDRLKVFNLTNSNGITIPVYTTNQIRIDVSGSQSSIEEGEYVWELRRTDLNAPYMSGLAYFVFDSPQ